MPDTRVLTSAHIGIDRDIDRDRDIDIDEGVDIDTDIASGSRQGEITVSSAVVTPKFGGCPWEYTRMGFDLDAEFGVVIVCPGSKPNIQCFGSKARSLKPVKGF